MNRQPLEGLTPELIERVEQALEEYDEAEFLHNGKLIIECMRVALRWRNDLDQMKEERG